MPRNRRVTRAPASRGRAPRNRRRFWTATRKKGAFDMLKSLIVFVCVFWACVTAWPSSPVVATVATMPVHGAYLVACVLTWWVRK